MAARNPEWLDDEDGELFGPYVVFERIGIGGMATVHRAVERGIEGFERVVALKRLLPHLAEDGDFVRSFVREAKLASQLQHINICQIYELGRVGPVYFISMEHIDGHDVRQLLRQARRRAGPPPVHVAIAILLDLCDALDYAHSCTDENGEPLGLVHRDVSPSNVLIASSGHVKVIDFGIAKATSQKQRTATGRVKGKLAYMAPEAIRGAGLDARSDIFSTGVIAHELLTARPLFACKNDYDTLTRVQKVEVDPPSAENSDVPPELDAIVLKALAKDADKRWTSAAELRDALDQVRQQHHLNATNREVKSWISWAFSEDATTELGRPGSRSHRSAPKIVVPPTPSRPKTPAPEAPEEEEAVAADDSMIEEEIADIAWGKDDENVPVLLDEVPDLSGQVPRSRPLTSPPMAAAAPDDDDDDDDDYTAVEQPAVAPAIDGPAIEPLAAAPVEPQVAFQPVGPGPSAPTDSTGLAMMEIESPTVDPVPVAAPQPESPAVPRTWPHGTQPPPALPIDVPETPPQVHTRTRPARASTAFGSTIIERPPRTAPRIVAGAAIAAAAIVLGALLITGGDEASPTPATQPAPALATVKFLVEPADAVLSIDGVVAHRGGFPHTLKLGAGTHRIELRHDGYKSWVSPLAMNAEDIEVVHHELEPVTAAAEAKLNVSSTPAGLRVELDGHRLRRRTPVTLDLAPGDHALAVIDRNGRRWKNRFTADENTQYAFHPIFADEVREKAPRTAVAHAEPSHREAHHTARHEHPAHRERSIAAMSALAPLPVSVSAPPRVPDKQASESPAAPHGPVVVPPSAVHKLRGEIPRVYGASEMPAHRRIGAKLCIDPRGHVTSVHILSKVMYRVERDLKLGLHRWRYKPYRVDGERVPACFAINFSVSPR
jgi:serine/threonine protein kinase